MKRLTILVLGVFCFCLILTSTAEARPLDRLRHRGVRIERTVEVKRDVKVQPLFRLLPSRCPGGTCPTR